jgi:single-strand DNA-binding protein
MNHVILIGRVGKDPEIKNFNSDIKLATFSLATSKMYKDKKSGEKKEVTQWHTVSVWNGLAGIAEKYVRKGDRLCITGEIEYQSWESRDGERKYATRINAENMEMLGSPKNQNNHEETHAHTAGSDFDDVPDWLK